LVALQNDLDATAGRVDYDRVEQLNFEFDRTIDRLAHAPKISWLLGARLRYAPRESSSPRCRVPGGLGP